MKKAYFFLVLLFFGLKISLAQQNPSLNMRLLARWHDENIPRESGWVKNRYNEVWGWFNPKDGREYAVIGSTIGTHIIDITDIHHVYQAAFVKGRYDNAIHRDFKTLQEKYIVGVCDQGKSSLQIIDMSYLPDSVHVIYNGIDILNRSHNVYVEGNKIYAVFPIKNEDILESADLTVIDASDPGNPKEIKKYINSTHGRLHDLHVRNDTMYANAEGRGLHIVDMKDPFNPVPIAQVIAYPHAGYNHSGWLNEKGNVYVMADENHGLPVKILDVSKKDDPQIVSFLAPNMVVNPPASQPIPHNALVKGDIAFVSYYYHGVQVFDVSEPKTPKLVGSYDTYPDKDSLFYAGAWGVYPFLPSGHILASDTEYGLYVLGFNIDSTEKASVQVYPNYEQGYIKFFANQLLTAPTLKIYNVLGQLLYQKEILTEGSEFYVEFPAWATSLYFWTIEDKNKQFFSGKFLK
ncbi:MAG: choice-of-anchor B family protein [Bacteroidia bacterium]